MVNLRNRSICLISGCLFAFSLFSQNNPRQHFIDSLTTVLSILKEDTNKVNTYVNLGACLKFQDYQKAMNYTDSAVRLAAKLGFKKGEATAELELGLMHADFVGPSNYPEAKKQILKAIDINKEIGNDQALALCYNKIGILFYNEARYPEALKYLFESLRITKKINEKLGMASNYGAIANTYTNFHSQQMEAIKYRYAAIKIYEELNYKEAAAFGYQDVGALFNEQGSYADALKNLYKSLKIFEEITNAEGISSTLWSIGSVYNNLGNYEEALVTLQSALQKAKQCGNAFNEAHILSELGVTYHYQGNFNEALKMYNLALEIYKKHSDEYWSAVVHMYMARTYKDWAKDLILHNGNSDSVKSMVAKSLKLLSEAKTVFETKDAKDAMAEAYRDYGTVLMMQASFAELHDAGEIYKEAIGYFEKAIPIAKEIGTKKVIRDSYGGLAEIYARLKDYEKAIEYSNIYMEKKDSLFNNETVNKIEELKMQYEKERTTTQLQYAFSKKEDSIKYQKQLAEEKLNKQLVLSLQQSQELQLKQASLDLSKKQNEVANLEFLKTQAELKSEQSQRLEKEKEISLKETKIQTQRRQFWFYAGGSFLIMMLLFFYYRNIKNRQKANQLIATEKLKSEKAYAAHKMVELELQSLRAQLNPHFMFNSLNAIQELILREDNDNSHLYLSRFAELLRMLLDNANQPFIALRKELNFLELYLSLENLRIPDIKFHIEVDPTIDTNGVVIPNMILQPYIENAIWHGLSHKKGERMLKITIKKNEEKIICEVEDNGVGRKMATALKGLYRKEHRSRGMELLSRRFNLLSKEYGSDIQAIVEDLHDNGTALGTKVTISVYALTQQVKWNDKSNYN